MKNRHLHYLLFAILSLILAIHNVYAKTNPASDPIRAISESQNQPTTKRVLTKNAIDNMLLQSVSLMGIPYRWGGNTPQTGMDCSGFVRYVFKKSLGITLPRTAAQMARLGKRVKIKDLQPGDLLFFNIHHSNSHMGMYIGNNQFIQSPHTGDTIKITKFNSYWRRHFNGAKRIVQEDKDENGHPVIENFQNIRNQALPTHMRRRYHKRRRHRYHHRVHHRRIKHKKKRTVKKHSTHHRHHTYRHNIKHKKTNPHKKHHYVRHHHKLKKSTTATG